VEHQRMAAQLSRFHLPLLHCHLGSEIVVRLQCV
jgi:hypothetical protein